MFENSYTHSMEDYYSPSSGIVSGSFDHTNPTTRKGNKVGKSGINKRRFSDEQITSLESIFESETRLDPGKKVEVARELGLQPRQVAIWFQNKRARWKSKQLEHDYAALRAGYTDLESRMESLKKEKHALVSQLEKLKDLISKCHEATTTSRKVGLRVDETIHLKVEPAVKSTLWATPRHSLPLSDDESTTEAVAWYLGILEEKEDECNRRCSLASSTTTRPGPNSEDDGQLLDSNHWWDYWS